MGNSKERDKFIEEREVYKKKIGWEIVEKEKSVGRMEVEDKKKKTRNKRLKGKHNWNANSD